MSIGINYDDWIIIRVSYIGIEGRCASRETEFNDVRRRLYEWCIP